MNNPTEKKVYCGDCIWGNRYDGFTYCSLGSYDEKQMRWLIELGISTNGYELALQKNKFRECGDYKRKWWKIWK